MITPFSVYGCWQETQERFAEVYRAGSARLAESLAQLDASDRGGTLLVARVVAGEVPAVDRYTLFTDPEDPRNQDAGGIEPDVPDLLRGLDPDWTVFGIALPPDARTGDIGRTGERYGDWVNASSAKAAEDVARSRIADKGGWLWVCAVLEGSVRAADTYATFVNPDVKAR
ncbi:MAG TPA: hypothetical protein VFB06_11655 [Streptosporangiaceae bacterium]|nr:hypothetical protein [Streptosporangiaceae bacterium]